VERLRKTTKLLKDSQQFSKWHCTTLIVGILEKLKKISNILLKICSRNELTEWVVLLIHMKKIHMPTIEDDVPDTIKKQERANVWNYNPKFPWILNQEKLDKHLNALSIEKKVCGRTEFDSPDGQ
jgi:hypothetical protein